jgi:hypothetical protein
VRGALVGVVLLAASGASRAEDASAPTYFPLRPGSWWAYEEQDEEGRRLARETWMLTPSGPDGHAGELHLRSLTKRVDALHRAQRRWEGHEYLRVAPDGIRKRYPAAGEAEVDVLLLKEPPNDGTRWTDSQGDCEVARAHTPCTGPEGELPECLVVVCRLGRPVATIVTSTYARGVGMVRQELELLQLMPSFEGGPGLPIPGEGTKAGRSVLRLIDYHLSR